MKEIKFRAWETREKRMLNNGQFNIYLYHDGYGISHHFHDESERKYAFTKCKRNNWDETKPEVILMQYTGRKDRNDKEICDKDILKSEHNKDCIYLIKQIAPIEWKIYVKFKDTKLELHSEDIYQFLFTTTYFEVIGNIYKNPELLEDK